MTKLLGLRYKILYRKGKENIVANAISRKGNNKVHDKEKGDLGAMTKILPPWYEEVHASYDNDSKIQNIIIGRMTKTREEPDYTYEDGVLRYKVKIVVGQKGELRAKLVKFIHDSYVDGHAGIQNSYKRLKENFYWFGMKRMVKKVVDKCNICRQAKVEKVIYPGLLQPLSVPSGTWKAITMDFIEGLPKLKGRNVIMVVINRFIKYGHFIALDHPFTAQDIMQLFLDHFYKFHGLPAAIVTDRDKVFTNKFWKELFKKLGIRLMVSTTYHLQTDSQLKGRTSA